MGKGEGNVLGSSLSKKKVKIKSPNYKKKRSHSLWALASPLGVGILAPPMGKGEENVPSSSLSKNKVQIKSPYYKKYCHKAFGQWLCHWE